MSAILLSHLLLIFLLLIASAFFSGTETALMKLSKIKVKHWIQTRTANSDAWANWLSNPQELITTILVGNTLVTIFLSSMIAVFAMNLFPGYPQKWVQIFAGIAAFLLILIFAEIVPKIYCIQNPEKVSSISLGFLFDLSKWFAKPLRVSLEILGKFFPVFRQPTPGRISALTLEEIRAIISDSASLTGLEREHHEMMRKVLELHQTTVQKIMTPWKNVDFLILEDALAGGKRLERFVDELIESGRTRLPVVKQQSAWPKSSKSPQVIGYLLVNDLLSAVAHEKKIEPAFFQKNLRMIPIVLGDGKLSESINVFRFGCPIACVQDRTGFTLGIVTLEDILEEFVGEILDEYDIELQGM